MAGGIERRLERGIDGFLGRVFRSGLTPVDMGRRMVREMDAGRTVGVSGKTVAPNHFVFTISEADAEQLAEIETSLTRELVGHARDHAQTEHYRFRGPLEIELVASPRVRPGAFGVDARFREGPGGMGDACLVLPGGDRVDLDDTVMTIGRHPASLIVMEDPNVSRRHAEVRPRGDGFVLVDLASTNGTRVNGARITEVVLSDGDEMQFGSTVFRFEDE